MRNAPLTILPWVIRLTSTVVLGALFLAMAAGLVLPLLGYEIAVVDAASPPPGARAGDAVLVRKPASGEAQFALRSGDAAGTGRPQAGVTIPAVGSLLDFSSHPLGRALLVLLPVGLLLLDRRPRAQRREAGAEMLGVEGAAFDEDPAPRHRQRVPPGMPRLVTLRAWATTPAALVTTLALVGLAIGGVTLSQTMAYFTTTATSDTNVASTVTLNVTSSAGNSFLSVSNLIPGDFKLVTNNIVNGGNSSQHDVTYNVAITATSTSLLDSTAPGATSTSGGALLILRCSTDAAGATPAACTTNNVYVTQVYPTAGAGTQKQLSAGGLTNSVLGPVSTTAGNYSVPISGTAFTGGQLTTAAFNMGGPDNVTGTDGQSKGLANSRTDYLAIVAYLPTQISDVTRQGLSSTLKFTWTAQQKTGGAR